MAAALLIELDGSSAEVELAASSQLSLPPGCARDVQVANTSEDRACLWQGRKVRFQPWAGSSQLLPARRWCLRPPKVRAWIDELSREHELPVANVFTPETATFIR